MISGTQHDVSDKGARRRSELPEGRPAGEPLVEAAAPEEATEGPRARGFERPGSRREGFETAAT